MQENRDKLMKEKEMLKNQEHFYFKPKKGSVFPVKRKLVKRMVFEKLLHFFTSCFSPSSSSDKKQSNQIFPGEL
ncbi:hypothetical protein BVRB_1g010420 [Beta vulgaris subsp. vulgaris]|nr:hypothetical protein BVRB_1g010420 [Beta vulgaris subsp. vulgaris]